MYEIDSPFVPKTCLYNKSPLYVSLSANPIDGPLGLLGTREHLSFLYDHMPEKAK